MAKQEVKAYTLYVTRAEGYAEPETNPLNSVFIGTPSELGRHLGDLALAEFDVSFTQTTSYIVSSSVQVEDDREEKTQS